MTPPCPHDGVAPVPVHPGEHLPGHAPDGPPVAWLCPADDCHAAVPDDVARHRARTADLAARLAAAETTTAGPATRDDLATHLRLVVDAIAHDAEAWQVHGMDGQAFTLTAAQAVRYRALTAEAQALKDRIAALKAAATAKEMTA